MTVGLIQVRDLRVDIAGKNILKNVNLDIYPKEIIACISPSGGGKTTLLRTLMMLQPFSQGEIFIFGVNIKHLNVETAQSIQKRLGVMFQGGALFSSLTVLDNVIFPLQQLTNLKPALQKELALLKINAVEFDLQSIDKYPAELSGGMKKRVALARALVLDPELVFLDEPTAGLDPHSARAMDELLLKLRENLNLTLLINTHDVIGLQTVSDRVIFLGEGTILAAQPYATLLQSEHPLIRKYFAKIN